MNRFRFTKVRDVPSPKRGNVGDAGIDFYTPVDLTEDDLLAANKGTTLGIHYTLVDHKFIDKIELAPNSRVIIPSGIKGLLEPVNTMLQANNKSGVSTRKGLVFTAQVVDSTYTGEIHICVVNTSNSYQHIEMGTKLMQFIHIPVYLTEPEEITNEEYEEYAKDWSNRGSDWKGSTDNQ